MFYINIDEIDGYGEGGVQSGGPLITVSDSLTSSSTSNALSANMGRYLKSLVDGKAASSHGHSVSDITGVLPVEKGGTGGTTPALARQYLSVMSSDEVITHITTAIADYNTGVVEQINNVRDLANSAGAECTKLNDLIKDTSNPNSITSQLNDHESRLDSHESRLDTHDSDISSLGSDISSLGSDISSLDGSVQTVDGKITDFYAEYVKYISNIMPRLKALDGQDFNP